MLNIVNYDRTLRQYVLQLDGHTQLFPCGRNGRQDAFRAAVGLLSPRLHRLVLQMTRTHPALESRAWKAAEIVLSGGVLTSEAANVIAMVVSQSSEYGDYTIQRVAGVYACDCEDFQGGTAVYISAGEQPYCKHILAYRLAGRLQYRRCYHCKQLVDAGIEPCPLCGELVTPF